MLARLAENLFLAGRALEHAEATARMADVTYHTLLESPSGEVSGSWSQLLEVLDHDGGADSDTSDGDGVLHRLVLDRDDAGSVTASLTSAREHIRSVRELVSTDLWEVVNDLYLTLTAPDAARSVAEQPYALLTTVRRSCLTIYGVASETMPRDDGWRFLALGRVLERARMTCRLVDVRTNQLQALTAPWAGNGDDRDRAHVGDADVHQWVAVLKSAAALDAYRRRYRASMDPVDVVEFLLLEPELPRSVVFCLIGARTQLEALARGRRSRAVRELGRATASLTYRDVSELVAVGLHPFLADIQARLGRVDTAIRDEFFRHHPSGALHAIAST